MADEPKLPIGNVVVYNINLDFCKRYVSPFIDKYVEKHGKYPTWDILDEQFRGKVVNDHMIKNKIVIKGKFRSWLSALIRRYREPWIDEIAVNKKENKHYNPNITAKLQARFDAILAASPAPVRGNTYTEEEVEEMLESL